MSLASSLAVSSFESESTSSSSSTKLRTEADAAADAGLQSSASECGSILIITKGNSTSNTSEDWPPNVNRWASFGVEALSLTHNRNHLSDLISACTIWRKSK
ncbi:O-Glycosyl hydrolases family 17 protein [Striga asiatica]|uniref:O-Glycosyl hydrolases family 17 protein n=1 Tax=Striga asiatica TaxID=4170 RepID=A0A5A7P8S6_STRAF|nr:O-Glycosyl hydrolases family 17 protein [Striga asiatica]